MRHSYKYKVIRHLGVQNTNQKEILIAQSNDPQYITIKFYTGKEMFPEWTVELKERKGGGYVTVERQEGNNSLI